MEICNRKTFFQSAIVECVHVCACQYCCGVDRKLADSLIGFLIYRHAIGELHSNEQS